VYLNAEAEPWMAVNPATLGTPAAHLIAVWQQDRWSDAGARGIVGSSSLDGGRTWAQDLVPFTGCSPNGPSYALASDPWVSIGPDGVAYAAALVWDSPSAPSGIAAVVSLDQGKTWRRFHLVSQDDRTNQDDKETITADPRHPGTA
jgi:hypothetical protein